jgi:serine/threonine-protein kinase
MSPDGKQVAFATDDGRDANVWIHALAATSSPRQLTLAGRNRFPIWTPDGQRIAFQSDREGDLAVFWQRADGTTAAERLTRAEAGAAHIPRSWSPDGKTLLVGVTKDFTFTKSMVSFSLPDRKTTPFADEQSTLAPVDAMFSPDGRWVAYTPSSQSNVRLFVQPFPATGAKYLIASSGSHPVWSPDGKELYFYLRGQLEQLNVVSVTTVPTFAFGNAMPVPNGNVRSGFDVVERQYDITPDGKRFIGVVDAQNKASAPVAPQIQVVLNWLEELKQRVPVK